MITLTAASLCPPDAWGLPWKARVGGVLALGAFFSESCCLSL